VNDDQNQIDRWIDSLLSSSVAGQIEAPPQMVLQSVADSIVRRRRRYRFACCTVAAAAMLLVAVNWGVFQWQATPDRQSSVEVERADAMQANVSPAVFLAGDDSIAVPVASQYPDIAIVRVYAVYRPAEEQDSASLPESATDTITGHEPFNGG
jgi:hypothetical protein